MMPAPLTLGRTVLKALKTRFANFHRSRNCPRKSISLTLIRRGTSHSTVGAGTIFTEEYRIKIHNPDPANRLYKHVMNHEIFVVDDNADYQFLFFKLIKELHKPYSVKFFEHGKALHQHVVQLHTRQAGQLPALVVSDFNMPGMNGLQLLKMLKTTIWDDHVSLREIPVVIMSNDISEHQILQCYQAGANAVVLKPIDFEVMKTTVRSICEFWLDRGTYAGGGVPV
jgi:CheY-like chemotaxis protein